MDDAAATLAARIRKKDQQALVEFIELRRPQLVAFIERNLSTSLGRKLEAADILQDVSLSAVTSLGTFELGDRDPFSWLCQLAEHRIIDAHRKLVAAQSAPPTARFRVRPSLRTRSAADSSISSWRA